MSQNPDILVDVYQKYTGGVDVFRSQQGDYPDRSTYLADTAGAGGWREPIIMDVGSVDRAASNVLGEFESSRVAVKFRDTRKLFLARLDDPEKQVMAGSELLLRIIPREARILEQAPAVLFRGPCREYGPTDDMDFTLVSEDVLGSRFGPFGLDKVIGSTKFGLDFPDANKDVQGLTVPAAFYGEHNDTGTTLSTGESFSVGMVPARYCAERIVTSTQIIPPSTVSAQTKLPPPPAPTYEKFGSGGSHTYSYAFCARTATGRTTLGGVTTISGLPAMGDFSPSNGVELKVAKYPPDIQAQVTGLDLFVRNDDYPDLAGRWFMMDAAGQAFTTGYRDDGDDRHDKGFYAGPPSSNTATISGTITTPGGTQQVATGMHMFVVCEGYCKITGLYGSPITADNSTFSPGRVLIDPASSGFVMPDGAGWPLSVPYLELTNAVDGITRRYTVFFGNGPQADAAVEGRVTLAVELCGDTQTGNPSSPVIQSAFYQAFRFLNDWVLANNGRGNHGLAHPANVTFPGSTGVEILNYDSFEACQAYTRRRMGNSIGAIGRCHCATPVTLREWLRKFAVQFDCFFYANSFGQICCGIIDENLSLVGATRLREHIEIKQIAQPQILDDAAENKFTYQTHWHHDLQKFQSDTFPVQDPISQGRHQGGVRENNTTIGLDFISDAATAASLMDHRRLRLRYAPRTYMTQVHFGPGLNLEIGQVVLVTHRKVNGTNRAMLIMGHSTSIPSATSDGYVTLKLLDLGVFYDDATGTVSGTGIGIMRTSSNFLPTSGSSGSFLPTSGSPQSFL